MTGSPPRHQAVHTRSNDHAARTNQRDHRPSRRRFLALAGSAAGLLLINRSALAARPIMPERRLFLVHPHSGEAFDDVYWAEGRYLPESLWRINTLLRDPNNEKIIGIDPELLDLLARLRARLGTEHPIELLSGYRSPESNAAARKVNRSVARNSLHMQGQAADVRVKGYSLSQLRQAAWSLQGGGVGVYPRRQYLHVDVGPVRKW